MEPRKRTAHAYSFDELKKMSVKFEAVDFSHGEPTTSPELEKYVSMARSAGFKRIGITTNGRMLSVPGCAEKLARAGMDKFGISIHGHNSRTHDALTRTPGSFEQSIKNLCDSVRKKSIEICGDSEFVPLKTVEPLMNNPKYPELLDGGGSSGGR